LGENFIRFAAFKKHIGLYPGGEATFEFTERLGIRPVKERFSYRLAS
jgi:hypothetical protein